MNLTTGDTRLIINTCAASGLLRNQCAYVLGTAWHETGGTMRPVRETFAKSDAGAIAALTKAWKSGRLKVKKDYWSGGFFGRGYVQLTHEDNYRHAGEQLNLPLTTRPTLALEPDTAAKILVVGMRDGWFAGDKNGRHKLDRYITLTKSDFVGARRIVNGTDRADTIAGYARDYDKLLKAGEFPLPDTKPTAPVEKTGIWASILSVLLNLFKGGK